jgi:hypothetical protein
MAKRNLAKEAKIARILDRFALQCQMRALKHLEKVQTDPAYEDQKWSDRSTRTVVNLDFARMAAANARAKQLADAGPRVFGVVAVVNRIDDHAKWEEMARAVEAGKQVIDVEALSAVPAEIIHGARRTVGEIPDQLGSNLPAGKAEQVEVGVERRGQREAGPELHLRVSGGEAEATGKEAEQASEEKVSR